MILNWNPKTTKPEVRDILRTLAEEYPLKESAQNVNLILEKNDEPNVLRVTRRGEVWFVSYGRDSLAARGVAYALSAQECDEKMSFKTFGILFDCTRGNVITVKHFKHWLRRLALMGYNLAMIYTKDAYQLPDEPYFGYMRGAYSLDELKEIDAYAKKLRIEMIGSIQVLGHLEPILRWGAYHQVRDTSSAIMVDEPETYELVEKMIKFWSEAFSSRRIHLGMDECQDLGRGRFMNEHGYESQFDLYNRHLGRVSKICDKFKLEPIIWSDMYFRYANAKQEYYDTKSRIPDEVKKAIPKNVRFSYWDYYHREPEIYESMLARTGELNGTKPIMASGVWTWKRFWTDYEMTGATVRPCIRACRKTGTDELIFTLWGDDGGYCEFDSAFAALAWAADYASNEKENEDRAAKLFEAVCGTSYRLQMICGALCYTYNGSQDKIVKILPGPLLWDDPLMGIARREFPAYKPELAETLLAGYRKIMELTGPHRADTAAGHLNFAWNLANVLVLKLELRKMLEHAYAKHDFNTLETIAERYVPDLIDAIDGLLEAFRVQWKRSFKSFGLELMQIRLGGLSERYRELARVLEEFVEGEIDSIPELEVDLPTREGIPGTYHEVATGNFFI
ncbi:MAG: family 20 glycosylhydrolase [Lentisphaeria bacterium]|nr:family 20 glycosylhydrolase [Lentisphaeria bacterium]